MFLNKWMEDFKNYKKDNANEVKHEYGHTVQLSRLGLLKYIRGIGIPSFLNQGTGYYYNKPWEITADLYGGVTRSKHTEEAIHAGYRHMEQLKQKK